MVVGAAAIAVPAALALVHLGDNRSRAARTQIPALPADAGSLGRRDGARPWEALRALGNRQSPSALIAVSSSAPPVMCVGTGRVPGSEWTGVGIRTPCPPSPAPCRGTLSRRRRTFPPDSPTTHRTPPAGVRAPGTALRTRLATATSTRPIHTYPRLGSVQSLAGAHWARGRLRAQPQRAQSRRC
jgi:hypothetical protein